MSNENLKIRTKKFALEIIKLVEGLPNGKVSDVLGRQLLRSGTSVAANYRSACRAKSPADFISKLGTVEEEADESVFWLEMLSESGKMKREQVTWHLQEGNELIAIMISSINTVRKRSSSKPASSHAMERIPHSALRTPN